MTYTIFLTAGELVFELVCRVCELHSALCCLVGFSRIHHAGFTELRVFGTAG